MRARAPDAPEPASEPSPSPPPSPAPGHLCSVRADAATAYNNVAAALQAEGELERAMEAYELALGLQPEHASAAANRDKLPISGAYRAAAAHESRVLASRAARAILASMGRRAGSEGGGLRAATGLLAPSLHRVTRYLRRLETKQLSEEVTRRLWGGRAEDMPGAIQRGQQGRDGGGVAAVTLSAFAWGGVWYQTLAAAFTHPMARVALGEGGRAVVLGSSIGFEAYFLALAYGVPTVGVELLCGLAQLSEEVRSAHGVPSALARFECADALDYRLPRGTTLVYVDDTAWDEPTIKQLAARLARQLPSGSVVVHNSEAGYDVPGAYTRLQAYEIGTSWNPAHNVVVHAVA